MDRQMNINGEESIQLSSSILQRIKDEFLQKVSTDGPESYKNSIELPLTHIDRKVYPHLPTKLIFEYSCKDQLRGKLFIANCSFNTPEDELRQYGDEFPFTPYELLGWVIDYLFELGYQCGENLYQFFAFNKSGNKVSVNIDFVPCELPKEFPNFELEIWENSSYGHFTCHSTYRRISPVTLFSRIPDCLDLNK